MHFAVAVFSKTIDGYRELLAPYGADCKVEFCDLEEKERKRYENDVNVYIELPDGSLLPQGTYGGRLVKGAKKRRVPIKQLYSTFDDYMRRYHKNSVDPVTGKYGYWRNPRAKWNYYVLGGFFQQTLLVPAEAAYKTGYSNIPFEAPDGYVWADVAQVKEINWELRDKLHREWEESRWDEYQEELQKGLKDEVLLKTIYSFEEGDTKESYIERRAERWISAVVLPDGTWHEGNEDKRYTLTEWLDRVNPDWYLAIIDCYF